uniref:hypothetical protein n=1 Tax=Microbulbifer agarilyticus TaxID=260552 RepID=UPI0002558E3C|nr:hypothetical protein [Microbulbifer agarilyticus]
MSKQHIFILIFILVTPIFSSAQESCEEKLEIASKICTQMAKDGFSEIAGMTLDPGFEVLNALDIFHDRGMQALLKTYDFRIDAAVVHTNEMLELEISKEDRGRAFVLLSRAKNLREAHPSTAVDCKYYLAAKEILSKFVPPAKNPNEEESNRIRLERLRELMGKDSAK